MASPAPHKLPVIEFTANNSKRGATSWYKACNEVVSALEMYGCFVAVYDKISEETHNGVFEQLESLFDCPLETKVQNKATKPLFGYVGQIPMIPLHESMGIYNSNTLEGIHEFAKIMWPGGNDEFSEKILTYTKLSVELERIVFEMVLEKYGVGKYYESIVGSANYLCRVMKYREAKIGENKVAFLSHTDKSFMSTIHQNQVDGLEIQAKDGEWFAVDNLSTSSVVVMAGDAFMAWSNDRVKSPRHRVTMNGKTSRYSIGLFSFLENVMVQTPEEFIDDDCPQLYKPFDHLNFVEFYSKKENLALKDGNAIRNYCGL
ncbi:probable 2-oxoglutarate-dependent dioxygenase AOP1 [Andrographis paniculata]|uniref:probable 2-oxoglutarate-dependent dioxygenase AOP1 n=1 Tax=Andrographis paniculata TaxID=175694 RepID=UPI0021E7C33B|nr:probable 2-oxoglutarate-dependent dioxygenase AOP1 [Andrographis paniculata]